MSNQLDNMALLNDALNAAENGDFYGDNADETADKTVDETDFGDGEQNEQNTDNPATDDKAADKTDETETDNQAADGDNTDEKETVILAKDGKHTIPYEKLLEARNAEKAAKAELATLKAELDALRQGEKSNQATDETETVDDDLNNDEEVFMSKKDLHKFLNDTVAKQVNERLKIIEQQQAISVAEKHYQAIYTAHPDADSIVESSELENWISDKPSYVQSAIRQVLKQGTAQEVIALLNDFKQDTQPVPEQNPDENKVKQVVAEKINQAQTKAPNTLSDIDGAKHSAKSVDERINDLTPEQSINFFMGKSAEEIDSYLNR